MKLRATSVLSALSAAVLIVGALGSTSVEARPGARGGSHFRGGGGHHYYGGGRAFLYAAPLFVGAYLATRYYYPPPYYYPPAGYYPPAAPVYIEQPPAEYAPPPQSQAQPDTQAYWYYCADSRAYYPHVQSCASAWQRVAPQPPPR